MYIKYIILMLLPYVTLGGFCDTKIFSGYYCDGMISKYCYCPFNDDCDKQYEKFCHDGCSYGSGKCISNKNLRNNTASDLGIPLFTITTCVLIKLT